MEVLNLAAAALKVICADETIKPPVKLQRVDKIARAAELWRRGKISAEKAKKRIQMAKRRRAAKAARLFFFLLAVSNFRLLSVMGI